MKRAPTSDADQNPKKKQTTPSVVNITINNYSAEVAGPAPAPEPDGRLSSLFPDGQHTVEKPHKNGGTYYVIFCTRDGELRASCSRCRLECVDIETFAPKKCKKNHRKLDAFKKAVSDYETAYQARDLEAATEARQRVAHNRTSRCPSCQETNGKLSPAVQACKDLYRGEREKACLAQDGCLHPDCVERGPQAACVMQGDHIDKSTKPCHVASPGNYNWWATKKNGGVEALRAEMPKLQWMCGFCHQLEETSTQSNRCGNPNDPVNPMPAGKSSGTPEEVKQYKARHYAGIVYPKQLYVDAAKLAIGACAHCKREVAPDNVWCFHWDHIDERTKLTGKDTLAGKQGGVSGIVRKNAKRTALDAKGVKDKLDAEMAKCQLLCYNCHHRKTYGYTPRERGAR